MKTLIQGGFVVGFFNGKAREIIGQPLLVDRWLF